MIDATASPAKLLMVGRIRELRGDQLGAVIAYRAVILAGDAATTAEARRRLKVLVGEWAPRHG
jgi:hypothetical protein